MSKKTPKNKSAPTKPTTGDVVLTDEKPVAKVSDETVVAVTDEMKAKAGCITYWTAANADKAILDAAWAKAGLATYGEPPSYPSPEVAFSRACSTYNKGDTIARRRDNKDEGVEIVRVGVNPGKPNSYTVLGVAKLDAETPKVTELAPGQETMQQQFFGRYLEALQTLSNNDISAWLKELVCSTLNGVTLRDRGGVYFIDEGVTSLYARMVGAIKQSGSQRIFSIPAMRGSDVVEAVLDGLRQEAEAEVQSIMEDLAKSGDDALGERALATRLEKVRAKASKVAHYEKMLGAALPDLQEKLETLKASVSMAVLALAPSTNEAA